MSGWKLFTLWITGLTGAGTVPAQPHQRVSHSMSLTLEKIRIQTSCAIDCLQKGMLFPQTSLQKAQNGAEKFVSHKSQFLHGDAILVLNAGFGGLNAVLRVGRY